MIKNCTRNNQKCLPPSLCENSSNCCDSEALGDANPFDDGAIRAFTGADFLAKLVDDEAKLGTFCDDVAEYDSVPGAVGTVGVTGVGTFVAFDSL